MLLKLDLFFNSQLKILYFNYSVILNYLHIIFVELVLFHKREVVFIFVMENC
jgi:hypothetical protein